MNTNLDTRFATTEAQIVARERALQAFGDVTTARDPRAIELASDRYRKALSLLCRSLKTTDERSVGNALARLYYEDED